MSTERLSESSRDGTQSLEIEEGGKRDGVSLKGVRTGRRGE